MAFVDNEETTDSVDVAQEWTSEQIDDVMRNASHLATSLKATRQARDEGEKEPTNWDLTEDLDRTRQQIRSLTPLVSKLEMWSFTVAKCWFYHPRLVHGLLAMDELWEQAEKGKAGVAFDFYTLKMRQAQETLFTVVDEQQHPVNSSVAAKEVPTIFNLEEFLKSEHFETLYDPNAVEDEV
jgi:hypothetical protein